jgi:hypothetical protein
MPVSPSQARRGLEEMHTDDFKFYTKRIDKWLTEGGRTVATSDMSGPVIDRIVSEYRAAGWDVQRVADFRDGDFLQFSEPRY